MLPLISKNLFGFLIVLFKLLRISYCCMPGGIGISKSELFPNPFKISTNCTMLGCFVGYECSDTGKCALIKKKTKILSGTKLQSLENMNSDIAIVDKKLILKVSSDDVTGLASTLPPEVNLFNRNYRPSPIISPDFLFKQCCTDRNIPESCQSKCTYVNYTKETIMQMYLGRDECPLQFARELHFCAAQGSDHTKCCKNRGVDSTLAKDKCLVFCDQRPGSVAILDNTHIHCYMQFENIKECFASRMRG